MIRLPLPIRRTGFDYSSAVEILAEPLFFVFAGFLLYTWGYGLFHFSTEIFNAGVSFFIFIISYNTISTASNPKLSLLGFPYFFVGIFILIHVITSNNIVQLRDYDNIRLQISLTAKLIEAVSLFIICVFISQQTKIRAKMEFLILPYAAFSALVGLAVFHWEIFPACIGASGEPTLFWIFCESCLTFLYVLLFFVTLLWPLDKHPEVFFCIITAIFLKVISQVFFLALDNIKDRYSVMGHMAELLSFFFIYKALLYGGLKQPLQLLFYNLNSSKEELQDYTTRLTKANRKLADEVVSRKQAESQLQRAADLLKGIIVSIPVGICVGDTLTRAVVWNRRMEEITGIKEADILGQRLGEIYPEIFDQKVVEKYIQLLEKNEGFSLYRFAYHDYVNCDEEIYLNISGSPYSDLSGKVQGLVMVLENVTEQVMMERAVAENEKRMLETKELEKLRTEFFTNISHELRTPVNVILSSLQLLDLYLKDEYIHEKVRLRFYGIRKNCYKLLRLVNNTIDISKLEAGFVRLDIDNLEIVSLVKDICISVEDYIDNKGLHFVFSSEIESRVMAFDKEKLERIILNLLSNAIKFTPKGGCITVAIRSEADRVYISVKDTGIGIPEEKRDTIFNRYMQIKSSSPYHPGSGIGLSLVKALVELHNGRVSVNSTFGSGSEFTVELPARLAPCSQAVQKTTRIEEQVNYELSVIDEKE